jgi:hypothetical protein
MNVTFENVMQILEAADRIQAVDMKKHALSLIVRHFPKVIVIEISHIPRCFNRSIIFQVTRLPKFKILSRDLLLDILFALADDVSESKLCQDTSSISLSSEGLL